MAYSSKTYPSDGSTTDFAIPFDYLDASHVRVAVDKVLTTAVGSLYKVAFNNATNIRVDTVIDGNPVPTGSVIKLFRETPIANPAVVFGGGASLSSENLNKNSQYLTYALQEATDANEEFTKLYLGSHDTAPLVDNEGDALQVGAVYYNNVDGALNYWTGSVWIVGESTAAASVFRDAAEAARDAAVIAKNAAEAAATTAASDVAATINASVTAASGSATIASWNATSASDSAAIAATSASAAAASEAAAAASASSITIDLASQAEAEAGTNNDQLMTPLRTAEAIAALAATTDVAAELNATGSAPIYAARAWVKFNAAGGILGSGNVSSVTDNGTGDYTVNFTTAMQDTNYAVSATSGSDTNFMVVISQTTGSVRVQNPTRGSSISNVSTGHVIVFR